MKGSAGKRRPMLVVSADAFNQNLAYPKVLVVHVTSVRRRGGPYAWEVALPKGTAGLDRASVVKCNEIYTLLKDQLESAGATLRAETMEKVDQALAVALSLS